VLGGLRDVLGICTVPKSFSRRVNDELKKIWESSTGFQADSDQGLAAIDRKIDVRRAFEDGLQDTAWANQRLRQLNDERQALVSACTSGAPPQFDDATIMAYDARQRGCSPAGIQESANACYEFGFRRFA